MKILLAVDECRYSSYAAAQTSKLALNAWADVTILGTCGEDNGKNSEAADDLPQACGSLMDSMQVYRQMFLEEGPPEDNPYRAQKETLEWLPVGKGAWEEFKVLRGARKTLRLRLRKGDASQVLEADAVEDYDLIVLGYGPHGESLPGASRDGMQKIIENARASVLLVKQDLEIHNLVVCLDNHEVPQRSLELINLIATIHGAALHLYGVTREGWIEIEVDKKLYNLHRYFASNQTQVLTSFKDHAELLPQFAGEASPDLLVLWRGKQSILRTLFPKKWLGELVGKSQSSVLVLR